MKEKIEAMNLAMQSWELEVEDAVKLVNELRARIPEWKPIADLQLEYCQGYAVSKTVLLAIYYPETEIYTIKISRVWEENAERTLVDLKYNECSRVTHFMELPFPPEAALASIKE